MIVEFGDGAVQASDQIATEERSRNTDESRAVSMNDRPMASAMTFESAKAFLPLQLFSEIFEDRGNCTYTSLPLSSTTRPTASACHFNILSAICTVKTPSKDQTLSSKPLFAGSPRMASARGSIAPRRDGTAWAESVDFAFGLGDPTLVGPEADEVNMFAYLEMAAAAA